MIPFPQEMSSRLKRPLVNENGRGRQFQFLDDGGVRNDRQPAPTAFVIFPCLCYATGIITERNLFCAAEGVLVVYSTQKSIGAVSDADLSDMERCDHCFSLCISAVATSQPDRGWLLAVHFGESIPVVGIHFINDPVEFSQLGIFLVGIDAVDHFGADHPIVAGLSVGKQNVLPRPPGEFVQQILQVREHPRLYLSFHEP